ncbi:MAG: serine/threonine protein kinase [Mycobacteriaceae bacterium]|nr:serine/threonine protein kinase [Mycobacteriaceae bacterium]
MKAPELIGGRYELRGVLGRGGMAEVRDGWDTRLGRPVAIKIMHPAVDARPDSRKRFEVEARAAAALDSAHIVAVFDGGEYNGMPFIVMERLTGESLHDKIAKGPLPLPMVRSVLDDILAALTAAHEAGILHRDIKPANILFTSSGEAKVSDFGVAKTAQTNLTASGEVFGTMAYLSPDRVLGRPATPADDVYSLGVVGYEALTGRRAFPQENIAALAQAILHDQLPPIAALRPDVDPALAAVVEGAIVRDPALRFQSARAMRAALAGQPPALVGYPPASIRPGTRVLAAPFPPSMSLAPLGAPPRKSRWGRLLALGAVVAALVLALILIAVDSPRASTPQPVTTSTPVAPPPTPTMTTMTSSTTPAPTESAPQQPPVHKPGKPGKPGRGDEGD